jgi:phosphate starvation-inducible protein PhoH
MPIPNYLYGKQLTQEQKEVIEATAKHKVIFINANAGTGKTWLVTAIAKHMKKPMHYIFFPVLQDVLGLLPGTLKAKEEPFLLALKDALYSIGDLPEKAIFGEQKEETEEEEEKPRKKDKNKVKNPKYKEPEEGEPWVFPSSHTYWRGGNIEDAIVVIDEAQNGTTHELKKILTRCHDSCLVFVLGHVGQIDLKNPAKSGLAPYLDHTETTDLATICHLTKNFRGKISNWADKI